MSEPNEERAQAALKRFESMDSNLGCLCVALIILILTAWTISGQLDEMRDLMKAMDRRIATIAPASGPPAKE